MFMAILRPMEEYYYIYKCVNKSNCFWRKYMVKIVMTSWNFTAFLAAKTDIPCMVEWNHYSDTEPNFMQRNFSCSIKKLIDLLNRQSIHNMSVSLRNRALCSLARKKIKINSRKYFILLNGFNSLDSALNLLNTALSAEKHTYFRIERILN